MSFDTTARVAPEEQEMPACLPLVSSMGDERATMLFKEELEKMALADVSIKELIGNRQIIKNIAVPGRLVNIVVKG